MLYIAFAPNIINTLRNSRMVQLRFSFSRIVFISRYSSIYQSQTRPFDLNCLVTWSICFYHSQGNKTWLVRRHQIEMFHMLPNGMHLGVHRYVLMNNRQFYWSKMSCLTRSLSDLEISPAFHCYCHCHQKQIIHH